MAPIKCSVLTTEWSVTVVNAIKMAKQHIGALEGKLNKPVKEISFLLTAVSA